MPLHLVEAEVSLNTRSNKGYTNNTSSQLVENPRAQPSDLFLDPHFITFNGRYFSYHGECDLVLMKSAELD
jgi:hypothetical protein